MSHASSPSDATGRAVFSLDRLGSVLALLAVVALVAAPFVTYRANRIVSGEARMVLAALPAFAAWAVVGSSLCVALVAALIENPLARLAAAVLGLLVLFPSVGLSPGFVTPAANAFARVSPASGFWLLTLAFALLLTDALTRLHLSPWARLAALVAAAFALAVLLMSGAWDGLSILKEYASRADSFWREGSRHVLLALGSLAAASLVGLPLGILCHRIAALRAVTLPVLTVIQTIPSIALFGILMLPLGLLAAHVPLAAALGIRGIGTAPAFVALFLYSLLPIVANTAVGLGQVPANVVEAARGMGLSIRQRLFDVELPLALPVILTGIRIVLIQNLGLATVAALIGGGGFGTFVFQGIGQSAIDLVLLGTVPTVALSFAAAVVLDAAIELTGRNAR